MSLVDIEGKDGKLSVEVNFKANPTVEAAVVDFLLAVAGAIKGFSAVVKVEPPEERQP
jgi:hypothetical protein